MTIQTATSVQNTMSAAGLRLPLYNPFQASKCFFQKNLVS